MNRRNFLSTVAALPFMGWVVAKASSDVPMTATEVLRREAEMLRQFPSPELTPAVSRMEGITLEMMEEAMNPPILVDMGNNRIGEFRDGRWYYFKETDELG